MNRLPGKNSWYKNEIHRPANALEGFLHGLLIPFTLILSWIYTDLNIYENINIGVWYDTGYFVGFWFFYITTFITSG